MPGLSTLRLSALALACSRLAAAPAPPVLGDPRLMPKAP